MNRDAIETKETVVKCNGGGGILGHPVVYLNLGEIGKIVCPYCSKCFIKIYPAKTGPKSKGLRRAS